MSESISDSKADSPPVPKPAAVINSEPGAEQASTETPSKPTITFQGNSYDLASVVGVTIGGVTLLTCATCNLGYYCLPIIPIILGIIGLISAKDSVDPERTKLLSWLSLGSGALIILLILFFVVAYIGLIIFAIAADNRF
ncbi:MAG: hypothetical protein GY869_27465 [Planctomycetes bacterium]|nr:hypothetical protein [Planctomycetota bacterium]